MFVNPKQINGHLSVVLKAAKAWECYIGLFSFWCFTLSTSRCTCAHANNAYNINNKNICFLHIYTNDINICAPDHCCSPVAKWGGVCGVGMIDFLRDMEDLVFSFFDGRDKESPTGERQLSSGYIYIYM